MRGSIILFWLIVIVMGLILINNLFIKNQGKDLNEKIPNVNVSNDNNVANQKDWNLLLVNK